MTTVVVLDAMGLADSGFSTTAEPKVYVPLVANLKLTVHRSELLSLVRSDRLGIFFGGHILAMILFAPKLRIGD